jgi:hypothetical protein
MPLDSFTFLVIGTPFVFTLVCLGGVYYLLRKGAGNGDSQRLRNSIASTAVAALMAVGLPLFLLWVYPSYLGLAGRFGWLNILMALTSLVLSALFLRLFLSLLQKLKALGEPVVVNLPHLAALLGIFASLIGITWAIRMPPFLTVLIGILILILDAALIRFIRRRPRKQPDTITLRKLHQNIVEGIDISLGIVVACIVPAMTALSTALSIVLLVIQPIEMLSSYEETAPPVLDYTLVDMVHEVYFAHGRAALSSFVALVVVIGLALLLLSAWYLYLRRRVATIQSPDAAGEATTIE